MRLLVFEVEGARFALRAEGVREVLRAVAVSRLPRAPEAVLGIIDVRGTLVAVLDLRARFGLPPRALDPAEHFVVAEAAGRTVAVRADRVTGVEEVEDAAVSDPRQAVPGAEMASGAARLAEGLAVIHDLGSFLTAAEGAALDGALGALPAAGGRGG